MAIETVLILSNLDNILLEIPMHRRLQWSPSCRSLPY